MTVSPDDARTERRAGRLAHRIAHLTDASRLS
jgi:hypothetical protein